MITSLPLNDTTILIVNRDIALFLGVLFFLSLAIHYFQWRSTRWGLKSIINFLQESTWEIGIIFILRAFFYEMYIIPSSSMQPSVYPGDVILVNKYTYGIKTPGFNTDILKGSAPKRGDAIVFLDPQSPTSRKMIKRVIGLPGDKLVIDKNAIQINGQILQTDYTGAGFEYLPSTQYGSVRVQTQYYQQKIDQHDVKIQRTPILEEDLSISIEVPQGFYFVMGDNRENSKDSRYIGYVPERFICGRAEYVIMSFGKAHGQGRWDRLGVLP